MQVADRLGRHRAPLRAAVRHTTATYLPCLPLPYPGGSWHWRSAPGCVRRTRRTWARSTSPAPWGKHGVRPSIPVRVSMQGVARLVDGILEDLGLRLLREGLGLPTCSTKPIVTPLHLVAGDLPSGAPSSRRACHGWSTTRPVFPGLARRRSSGLRFCRS